MLWFLVDRILEHDPGKSITGVKCFTRSEAFFTDHFHDFPVVPGVLQIEMIAATGGKALKMLNDQKHPMLAKVVEAKFLSPIRPGDRCIIKVELVKVRKSYVRTEGIVEVEGKKVCEAQLLYTLQPADVADPTWQDPIIADWLKNPLEKMSRSIGQKPAAKETP